MVASRLPPGSQSTNLPVGVRGGDRDDATPALRSPEAAVAGGRLRHCPARYLVLLRASAAGSGPTSVSCVASWLLPRPGPGD